MSQINNATAEIFGYVQRGIASMEIGSDGILRAVLTDGTAVTLGQVVGEKGDKGDKGDPGDDAPVVRVFVLPWLSASATSEEKAANAAILEAVSALGAGEYRLFLAVGERFVPASSVAGKTAVFIDAYDPEVFQIYSAAKNSSGYLQSVSSFPETVFDSSSYAPASQIAIADYVAASIASAALTAGEGISISGGVVSVSYPDGDEVYYG